jgi:hypothetical protein
MRVNVAQVEACYATLASREALDFNILKAWVSDAVLIFNIWYPHLTPRERALVTALSAGAAAFTGASIGRES